MADPDSMKPFSPDEIQRILHHLQQPAVFMDMTLNWPVLHWTAEHLSSCLGDRLIRFRLGRKEETNTPLFETRCFYVEANLAQFLRWTQGEPGADVGPFCDYPKAEYWAYADYKYIALLFQDLPSMFQDVRWSEFGFDGRDGRESTLWIGTEGANTPCHLDSYGFNLVLQVQGRKRWHLFPPEDTTNLYPTRIPYEESSVFSQVDVLQPDLRRFPAFQGARAHCVTLQPGQVLYVPRHWWHYVESVDPVTVSVNSWVDMKVDDVMRVSEAVTRAVVCALKSSASDDNTDDWLNPTEEGVTSHNDNMQYVNLAVEALQKGLHPSELTQDQRDTRPPKRDCRGQFRDDSDVFRGFVPFSVPYGPHLTPVQYQQEHPPETGRATPKDVTVSSDTAPRTERARAVQQENPERSLALTQSGPRDCAAGPSENSSEDCQEPTHRTITTNDLLDCLVHPEVIAHVTKLLLDRHAGNHRTAAPSQQLEEEEKEQLL